MKEKNIIFKLIMIKKIKIIKMINRKQYIKNMMIIKIRELILITKKMRIIKMK